MAATLRTRVRSVWHPSFRRTFYSKRAVFTTINSLGSPATEEIDVWLGDPHEAYVIVPPHVSNAIKASSKGNLSFAAGQETYPLIFDHNARQFSCESEPFPQLVIPQDLPSRTKNKTSHATLFDFESTPTHTIALNGTPDFAFAKQSGESYRALKPVLDNLRDK